MRIEVTFSTIEMRDTLYDNKFWCGSISEMHVGQWLGYITVQIVQKYTHANAVYNEEMKEFGPKVSYSEMYDLIYNSAWEQDFVSTLQYNSEQRVWVIDNSVVSPSFYKEMKKKDTTPYRHQTHILKIEVGDVYNKLFYGAGDSESKSIAQWILQVAKEKIKILLNMEDLRDATVGMDPFLNLMGCATHYSWSDMNRILAMSNSDDTIDFAVDVQGDKIRIRNIELPASVKNAIKKVHEEIEEDKKQHKEFSVEEMFKGLMLSKDYGVKMPYIAWLERAVQNLLNVKKEMPSDFSICHMHGVKINFRDAIDDFTTHNKAGDKFEVTYSLSDECGEEGNSAIKFYDIQKVEE